MAYRSKLDGPTVCGLLLALCFGIGAQNQEQFVPVDNLKSRSVHWNTHLVTPLLLSTNGAELYCINQGGQRLAVFDPASMQKLADVPVGAGLVSMAERPGTSELWLVDKVSSAVTVLDTQTRRIELSIRVGAEPHGIAFTPSGDRAYVACSGAEAVDVIETASYSIATTVAIPAKAPRAVVHHLGSAWVLPHVSGNNTAPMGAATSGPDLDRIVEVRSLEAFPALNALPDRDLLAIPTQPSASQDQLDPGLTRTGLGTMLFNLHLRPGTNELWIPNTEALNAVHKGEKNFVAGQCVQNRITVVDAGGVLPPRTIDLDALAPAQTKCSQPTALVFDPVRPRVYVCGYGSDRIAVLALEGVVTTWLGAIDVPYAHNYPKQSGPRAAVVDAQGNWLYVLNKGDTSISKINLNALPPGPGFLVSAPMPTLMGWDSVASAERFGRNDLVHGENSKSRTTSCASCHVDGHLDGLAWDLGRFLDPEGTPNAQLAFALDDKGPMVTQSVRRMFGSGPYHWRGERASLWDFNQAFIDLLEREESGAPATLGAHFSYLENYMRRVSHVANPRQELDRRPTPQQARGARLFMQKKVAGGASCADCHTLPLGTSGEIVASHVRGSFSMGVVPQLRGVVDKLSPPFFIGGAFGTRTELGAGLSHGGAFASVQDLLLAPHPTKPGPAFDLNAHEVDAIAAFLAAFDTGLAPSTGYQATANVSNAASFAATELAYLARQALEGHCDLIFRAAPETFANVTVWPSGLYDPAAGTFQVAQAGAAAVTIQSLLDDAMQGRPVTFIGVPLMMGRPMALDRDVDGLFDLDELTAGTDAEEFDTDGDGFPDGYEVKWGLNPLVTTTLSTDTQAPALAATPKLVYATTNTLKFELETSEVCQVEISHSGLPPVQRLPLLSKFDFEFSVIVGLLEPGQSYAIGIKMTDPSGNVGLATVTLATRARFFPAAIHVEDIALSIQGPPSAPELHASVTLLLDGSPPPPGYVASADVFFASASSNLSTIASGVQQTLTANTGILDFAVPLPAGGQPGTLTFILRTLTASPELPLLRGVPERRDVGLGGLGRLEPAAFPP